MFAETPNKYEFKYLVTGISGQGIKQVYLPKPPPDEEILYKEENKWRPIQMPENLRRAAKIWIDALNPDSKNYNPEYICPLAKEITDWEDYHWKLTNEGVWIWNRGERTYLTRFYVFYLTAWNTYFGVPEFRITDLEICYWVQWWEENDNSFGGLLNTCRRYGKSALMGAWEVFRTIRSFGHFAGAQGENDDKVYEFYDIHILKPFHKLPYYFKPKYDNSTKQTEGISFNESLTRGQDYDGLDNVTLQSQLGYRVSKESAYDQAVLHTYVGEELGKTLVANVYERWKFVKPCLKRGIYIRGKHFGATTVEFMDSKGKGGKAYMKLFFESDLDQLQADGRTKSGLCVAFLPSDCALEGFFDEWGHPMRDKAREWILNERKSVEDNAKDYSDLVRKYPLYISEIFYINTERCEFDANILQNRRNELLSTTTPVWSKIEFYWENNVRFSRVLWRHNPKNGWAKTTWMPQDVNKEANQIEKRNYGGSIQYIPKNDRRFGAGLDPIDHGVVVEDKTMLGSDEFISARRSKPVLLVKKKYDSSIDGVLSQEELEARSKKGKMKDGVWVEDETGQPYQYKSGVYFLMMDVRPGDPNVLYERLLMICWFFGISLHVESQKPGVIRYFQEHNCGNFIFKKYEPVERMGRRTPAISDEGTPASTLTIQEYTGLIATDVQYFGHTYPFIELVDDLLLFNPKKTTDYDYTVAMGYCEMSCKMKPKIQIKPMMNLDDFLNVYDPNGELIN